MSLSSVAVTGTTLPCAGTRFLVALRGWGLSDADLVTLTRIGASAATALGANADFVVARDGGSDGRNDGGNDEGRKAADLVIHVVDLPRLVGERGEALWNAQGPAEAMQHAQAVGKAEIALCMGPASWLPVDRTGCWVLASGRGLEEALDILVRAGVLPPTSRPDGDGAAAWLGTQAASDLTCVLARHRCDDPVALSTQVGSFLQQAVRQAITMPSMLMVSASTEAPLSLGTMDGLFGAVIPLHRSRMPGMASSRAGGCQADLLLCFPWPRLQQGAAVRRRVSAA